MTLDEVLAKVSGEPIRCDFGCSPDNAYLKIQEALKKYPEKPYCVVENWVWVELIGRVIVNGHVSDRIVFQSFLLAGSIIEDSQGRNFKLLRTSNNTDFFGECIFVTLNTCYVLTGSGFRVRLGDEGFSSLLH